MVVEGGSERGDGKEKDAHKGMCRNSPEVNKRRYMSIWNTAK